MTEGVRPLMHILIINPSLSGHHFPQKRMFLSGESCTAGVGQHWKIGGVIFQNVPKL